MRRLPKPKRVWITSGEGAVHLGVSIPTFNRICRHYPIRVRKLPGGWRHYHVEDVKRIARESVGVSR
jgi:hypothetical protein